MPEQVTRLERLITAELGESCAADVDERLAALHAYREEIQAPGSDLTALKTLGNDTRYRIVRLLAAADRELCVCEITPVIDVSDSAVSHAMTDLWNAGLVTRRKAGTWRYYEVTERGIRLLDALDTTREDAR